MKPPFLETEALGAQLDDAQVRATTTRQPSDLTPLGIDAAYAVQHALLARRVARGEKPVGVKLGFTSLAKARQMGVGELIIGTITDRMQVQDGGTLDRRTFIHPRIEPEVAYLIGRDIAPDDPLDPTAIVAVAPALEIIDSRYEDFRFDLGDVVADNTSAAAFAVGPWASPSAAGDLGNRAVLLEIDSRIVETGSTAAILGDPARALPAAQRLGAAHGFALRAGTILLAGAATAAVALPARGIVEATITGLGRVSVRIEGAA
ncbi:MAG: 2-keto-4-pentenoate hydratase [Microbacterium sp.]|uniref:2-keto-4-pentenoate hydratase n=1 Tax=Microbacterium sp. TaxID=51671 RepID=UPI003A840C76